MGKTKLDIWLIKFCCRDSATLPSPLCGEVKDLVETLCALLDQLVPSPGVVALSAQPVHLHLLDQLVRPKNVVALAWTKERCSLFMTQLFVNK